jgi:peptidoglycan/LPS O-acetylase OafA/YrhL
MGDNRSEAPSTADRQVTSTGTPAPTSVTGRYLPALDGLRALAVAGVIAYHLGFGWAKGGYLGVDLFFVLSGFLITSLLLEEWTSTARIHLGAFWARRARRLLPALFLLLLAIAVFVVLEGRLGAPGSIAQIDLSGLRGDALATLFYVANWHSIFAHQSYFAQFAAPSPLEHTWSLAIEEQFYLLWPPFLLVVLSLGRRRFRGVGLAITVFGAIASAVAMALLYHAGSDPTRVYFGTDTRAFDLLCGASVAMMTAGRPQPGAVARRWLHLGAVPALAALGTFWVIAGSASGLPPSWMFEGGFLLCAVLAATVIADVRQTDAGPLGRLFSIRPLRWVGRISYGIYLWHWPVIVYFTQSRTGLAQPWLDLARVGLTVALAATSFYLVETPIRRRAFPGWIRWSLAPASAAALAGVVMLATVPAIAAPAPKVETAPPAPVPVTVTTVKPSAGRPAAVGVTVSAAVPGAGGIADEIPIRLPKGRVISTKRPLRVLYIGDSVMSGAELGLGAALGATGEVMSADAGFDGFGLSTDTGWRNNLPTLINENNPDLVIGTWSWDESCSIEPTIHHPPCALQQPVAYTHEIEAAVRLMLHTDHVAGVIFLQFPLLGPAPAGTAAATKAATDSRLVAEAAWAKIVSTLPSVFPGKVMYLPVGASLLLHGHFSSWLPPSTDPSAPLSQWQRVRMVDNVHMCPAGVVRYSDAVLADMTALFHLPAARSGWWQEPWTSNSRYDTPPGTCPADHPPGG